MVTKCCLSSEVLEFFEVIKFDWLSLIWFGFLFYFSLVLLSPRSRESERHVRFTLQGAARPVHYPGSARRCQWRLPGQHVSQWPISKRYQGSKGEPPFSKPLDERVPQPRHNQQASVAVPGPNLSAAQGVPEVRSRPAVRPQWSVPERIFRPATAQDSSKWNAETLSTHGPTLIFAHLYFRLVDHLEYWFRVFPEQKIKIKQIRPSAAAAWLACLICILRFAPDAFWLNGWRFELYGTFTAIFRFVITKVRNTSPHTY